MQTEETLLYTKTETRKDHRSLAFATSKQTSDELSLQIELLRKIAEAATVKKLLPHAQQANLFLVTTFYADNLLLEEANKCFEMDKNYGFEHEQQFALRDNCNEETLYQKLCQDAMKHDKPVEGNAKGETQAMNAPFGKKFDFDFKVSLAEETVPSDSNVRNHCNGNGASGMDAVAQANDIDKSQLSKSHRKRPKKRTWMIETTWNMILGMDEDAQLKKNKIQNHTVWVQDLRNNLLVTRLQMCSLQDHQQQVGERVL